MKHKIALVDDDENILVSVSMALEDAGFDVITFSNGETALQALQDNPPDLAILDVKMPHMDGFEVLRRLREGSSLPVVFLTSRDDEVDQFLGLRLGADDYIIKPFSQRLLIERIRAILRRDSMRRSKEDSATVMHGHLEMNDERYACKWRDKPVDLTVTEYLILKALTQHPGHVKSRAQLMDIAYGDQVYVDDRTVDSHIKRMRKKFKDIDPSFESITTVYGAGYRYDNA